MAFLRSRRVGVTVLALSLGFAATAAAPAQQDVTRIQRDQNEVLRKAQRLHGLMESLLARYEKEGDAEKVRLLKLGLQHLADSGLLQDVASVRSNLDSGAMAEAVRKQGEVVAELEQLLSILLQRPTAESLEKEIERTEELVRTAEELARRQAELQEQVDRAVEGQADDAERQLAEEIGELARDLRREADENVRQAGVRRPTLEAAIQRVRRLLGEQDRLEERAREELGNGARSETREQGFRLGELRTGQEDVQATQARRAELEALAREAEELRAAIASGDDTRTQQQRDRTQAALQSAARNSEPEGRGMAERQELEQLGGELTDAPTPDGTGPQAEQARRELDEVAKRIAETARELAQRNGEAAAEQQQQLAEAARELADSMREGAPQNDPSTRAVEQAAQAMERAAEAARSDDPARAQSEAAQAARQAAEARRTFQQANPDAGTQAQRMADEAQRTARGLRAAAEQPEAPEGQAAEALENAEEALRDVVERADQANQSGEQADAQAVQQSMESSRESLQNALQTLEQALNEANEGRERIMDAARTRNQELGERTANARQNMEQATQSGELSEAQRDAAAEAMQSAQEAMQSADQALQEGAQAQAANQQQRAADALERASREMAQNRPLTDEQRQQLAETAAEQERLREDIIRLAELLEERENRRAQEALSRAQQASEQAEQSLRRGDVDQAREQQQEAREQLEQAQQALEQERDRYQDLRQEELLFRIEEELQAFLDSQKEVTAETERTGSELRDGARMTRPMRRNLNRLGETERELSGKVRYVREALAEEGTLVFTHVLESNERDLVDVSERLAGRSPDPGEFTVLLQRDVEDRTEQLLLALQRERQRRREQRQQQQQQQQDQQQQSENQFGPQRERLVPIISELIMLKQMEEEMMQRTTELDRLIVVAGADGITDVEAAMAERLAHQHNALTAIFQQLKAQLEQALGQQAEGQEQQEGRGR